MLYKFRGEAYSERIHTLALDNMSLHQQFIKIAKAKNKLTYKLLQLLPQIYESKEYKKYTHTIEGYAMQFAQIPESTVRKTLKLEKHLKDKPILKSLIPKVGVHKISLVATLASPETEKIYAEKVSNMSFSGLQSLSKEVRGGPKINKIILELNQDQLGLLNLVKKKLGLELNNEEFAEFAR